MANGTTKFDASRYYETRQRHLEKLGDGEVWEIAKVLADREPARSRILDLGCGQGIEANYLAGFPGKNYVVYPFDSNIMVSDFHLKNFICGDALELESYFGKGYFDSVLCCSLLNQFEGEQKAMVLDGIKYVMKSRGNLYVSCPVSADSCGESYLPVSFQISDKIKEIDSIFGNHGFSFVSGNGDDIFGSIRTIDGMDYIFYQAAYSGA